MKITILIGLPASGKTTYGQSLVTNHRGVLVDDPKSLNDLPDKGSFDYLVLTHPMLCRETVLKNCIQDLVKRYGVKECDIDRIYFANDPETCLENANTRKDKHVQNLIDDLSSEYTPDQNCVILPCYRNSH